MFNNKTTREYKNFIQDNWDIFLTSLCLFGHWTSRMVSAVGRSHVRITSSSITWVVDISKLMLSNAMVWCSFIPLYHFLHFTLPALPRSASYSFFLYADISSLDTILVVWSLLRCTFNVFRIFTGRVFDASTKNGISYVISSLHHLQTAKLESACEWKYEKIHAI